MITLYALLRIFHTNGIKKKIAFIGVGYDDKNDDDREISDNVLDEINLMRYNNMVYVQDFIIVKRGFKHQYFKVSL